MSDPDTEDSAFLHRLGQRLRTLRARRGITRRELSRRSGVSERYIAQLESGAGNVSILLLRRIARAIGIGAEELIAERADPSIERVLLQQAVERLPEGQLAAARALLQRHLGRQAVTRHCIALVGLRGAGKSSLGRGLAERLAVPFVELDREVELEGRMQLADIFALQGQEGYRRLERAALQRLVAEGGRRVIATGGGIVAEPASFALLLENCVTVWLRASPEEHMRRVVAQGDTRPMRENAARAMEDLRAILASREALYAQADITLDTTGRDEAACLDELVAALPRVQ
ncbi:MAG: helix-turn-helix transcriptional regulator [Acetobacteraceae bacterium]|nr:helix-turn-helix transcriptional regulator [Acetobacteraceae bacterium]